MEKKWNDGVKRFEPQYNDYPLCMRSFSKSRTSLIQNKSISNNNINWWYGWNSIMKKKNKNNKRKLNKNTDLNSFLSSIEYIFFVYNFHLILCFIFEDASRVDDTCSIIQINGVDFSSRLCDKSVKQSTSSFSCPFDFIFVLKMVSTLITCHATHPRAEPSQAKKFN